jgi:DNA polymerase II small subunit/DNA polymerase delta subunit B
MQDVYVAKVWVWVPYSCYYHLYSKEELYSCAAKKKVSWIHTQGDSQEREFVSMMKMTNNSVDGVEPGRYEEVMVYIIIDNYCNASNLDL